MKKARKIVSELFSNLKFSLSRSFLGNAFNKVTRWQKSKRVGGKVVTTGVRLPQVNLSFFKFSLTRLGLIFGAIILLFIAVTGVRLYSDIQFNVAPFAKDVSVSELAGSNLNLLLIGYDASDNYSFVDFLAVAVLNPTKEVQKVIVINPDFVVKVSDLPESKLRNLMNNALLETDTPITYLYEAIQYLIGLKVDRYLAVEKDAASEFMNAFNWQYISTQDISDLDAGVYSKDMLVESNRVISYLAAEEPSHDLKGVRQSQFINSKFQENVNLSAFLGYALNLEATLASFSTDLSKAEFFDLAFGLTDTTSVDTMILTTQDATYVKDNFGGKFIPSILTIDSRVATFLGRSDVIKEQARIEIFNATGVSGLASKHSRWIANQGGRIVRTGNYPDIEERSKLYAPNIEDFLKNIELIQEVMQGNVLLVNSEFPLNHTGDLVLVLGTDTLSDQD